MASWKIGIIGGSGLYGLEGLEQPCWQRVETSFGLPSDELLTGRVGGVEIVFLPRHGRGHQLPPSGVNARANIMAMKMLGVTDLLTVSAVGSLDPAMVPGDFVMVDQFIDRTKARADSFFGPGLVAHVSLAEPVCPRLSALAAAAAGAAGARLHERGTYLAMEGPQFSTRAESRLYRQWGAQVIGMTAMPEARLAREAELPYAALAMVTDFDSWNEDAEPVAVPDILRVMARNAAVARATVTGLVASLPADRAPCAADRALDGALVTAPDARDPALVARLAPLLARLQGATA